MHPWRNPDRDGHLRRRRGTPLCGTLSGDPATATCTTTYPGVTDDSITANYPGDGNYVLSSASSTLSVDQATTSTAVAPDDSTPVVGEQVTYTATVSVTPPDPATPTGTVSFTGTERRPPVHRRPVSAPERPPVDARIHLDRARTRSAPPIRVTPTSPNSGSSTSVVIGQDATTTTVSASPSPAVVGQAVTLAGVVAPVSPGAATPTGSVSFSDAGGTCTGTAEPDPLPSRPAAPRPIRRRSHDTVTGSYGGDVNDAGSPGTTTETVKPGRHHDSSAACPQPVVAGGRPDGDPGGDGCCDRARRGHTGRHGRLLRRRRELFRHPLREQPDTASCTTSFTGATPGSVTATYGGDTNDVGSSGTTTVTVGTADTMTASCRPVLPGGRADHFAVRHGGRQAPGAGVPHGNGHRSPAGARCARPASTAPLRTRPAVAPPSPEARPGR